VTVDITEDKKHQEKGENKRVLKCNTCRKFIVYKNGDIKVEPILIEQTSSYEITMKSSSTGMLRAAPQRD
jgi:hypothetical protein